MLQLDRLGWAAGANGRCLDLRVGVRTSQAGALDGAIGRLPPGWSAGRGRVADRLYSLVVGGPGPRPGVRRMHLVYADAALLARTAEGDAALDALESDARLFVAEHTRRRVFVHAGAVGWRGRAIVVAGASHTGKSRLVEALVAA